MKSVSFRASSISLLNTDIDRFVSKGNYKIEGFSISVYPSSSQTYEYHHAILIYSERNDTKTEDKL